MFLTWQISQFSGFSFTSQPHLWLKTFLSYLNKNFKVLIFNYFEKSNEISARLITCLCEPDTLGKMGKFFGEKDFLTTELFIHVRLLEDTKVDWIASKERRDKDNGLININFNN